jgi:apolipoprotein N-acyltransferase
LLASSLSGGLLWACHYPLAWGWCLGWFALVPLLTLVRSEARPRHLYWSAYLGGLIFFATVLLWMPVADPRMYFTWALLHVYLSMYFPLNLALIRWLDRRWRLPLVMAVPLVWLPLEYFRSWFGTGFSWYLLGHTVHHALPMIQIADLGGVFAVSLVVAVVNALLADVIYQIPAARTALHQREPSVLDRYARLEIFNRGLFADLPFRHGLLPEGLVVALLVTGAYVYGIHRLSQDTFEPGPTIALLQSNLDQRLRLEAAPDQGPAGNPVSRETVVQHFTTLIQRAVAFPPPDLLVWPETSYTHDWVEVARELPVERVPREWCTAEMLIRENLRELAEDCAVGRQRSTYQLLGLNTQFLDAKLHPRRYNSALLLSPVGEVESRFDKMHRVPFGEYVPLRDWLPFMNRFAPYDFDYSIAPGEKFTRFALGKYKFGVLICYEDSDMYLARHYAIAEKDGGPVDFLLNLSNDGWFYGSSEHDEHLAISRFRAIECRRALARAVNMGISAVIDGNGRVLQPRLVTSEPGKEDAPALWSIGDQPGEPLTALPAAAWARFKKTGLVLRAVIPLDRRESFYARHGDWLPNGCGLLLGSAVALAWLRRRNTAGAPSV